MWGKLFRSTVLLLVVAGCSTTATPATVPSSLPTTTSTVATTTTTLPATTTTAVATTTTIDRVSEIEAIFQDLEERRLRALYEGDEEAFKSLFANKNYIEKSLAVLDLVEFDSPPGVVAVSVVDLLSETETCIAALVLTDATDAFGSDGLSERIIVLEQMQGRWGFSYIGEGWACEGPHPLSP